MHQAQGLRARSFFSSKVRKITRLLSQSVMFDSSTKMHRAQIHEPWIFGHGDLLWLRDCNQSLSCLTPEPICIGHRFMIPVYGQDDRLQARIFDLFISIKSCSQATCPKLTIWANISWSAPKPNFLPLGPPSSRWTIPETWKPEFFGIQSRHCTELLASDHQWSPLRLWLQNDIEAKRHRRLKAKVQNCFASDYNQHEMEVKRFRGLQKTVHNFFASENAMKENRNDLEVRRKKCIIAWLQKTQWKRIEAIQRFEGKSADLLRLSL